MSEKKKTFWPKGIALATLGVIILSVGTIVIAVKNPVQDANDHMTDYKDVNKRINSMIEANIAFNSKYKFEYLAHPLNNKASVIAYRVTTQAGEAVNNADLEVMLTRPTERGHDISLEVDSVKDGVYTFKTVSLPLKGRWNLFANVSVETEKGYKRLKLDTRYPKDIEQYGIAVPMN